MGTTTGTTITNTGIITSFGNTPQAVDDYFLAADTGLTEETVTKIVTLDVMANDLGGKAKTLFAIDDGTSDGGIRPTDLLTQDLGRAESCSTDYSASHAHIWITADGKIGYDTSTWSDNFKTQLQHLGAGQYATDTFTYSIRMANGTLSWATATVQIAGVNDVPVLSAITGGGATEALDASAQDIAAIHGTLSVSDLDVGDTLTASVTGSPSLVWSGGALTAPQVTALMAELVTGKLSFDGTATSNGGAASIGYSYDPAAANLDFLRAGQTLTITYQVKVNDGTVDSGVQDVTFTITGTNDAPVLSDTTNPDAVAELGNASAQDLAAINGSFSVTDLDVGDSLHASVVGSPTVLLNGVAFSLPAGAGALTAPGAFTLTDTTSNGGAASIGYSYDPAAANLDFLRAGQTLTITYQV
ncbi:MAG TPA: VCBS domain-containing protein, partial [Dongiaceae bacterium]|nr:VCBS domain-containing protein [Dongiaceae bacterium]